MKFYVRLDEESKSSAQIVQRERTYEAAKLLNQAGFRCTVQELFTGKNTSSDAASITLDL